MQCTVQPGHSALQWLLTTTEPSGRVGRWALQLQEYDFKVYYRPGHTNVIADALSRAPADPDVEDDAIMILAVSQSMVDDFKAIVVGGPEDMTTWDEEADQEVKDGRRHWKDLLKLYSTEDYEDPDEKVSLALNVAAINIQVDDISRAGLQKEQLTDPFCKAVRDYLDDRTITPGFEKIIPRIADNFVVSDGVLMHFNVSNAGRRLRQPVQIVVPSSLVKSIMREGHSLHGGHLGVDRTFALISERYHWPRMGPMIADYCHNCKTCQMYNPSLRSFRANLVPFQLMMAPWELISCDFVGPLLLTIRGNCNIVVFMDYLTRWPEVFACKSQTSEEVAWIFVDKIYSRFGAPRAILTDRGTAFDATLFGQVMDFLGVKHRRTTSYHPQTNGLCERFNGTLCSMLRKFCGDDQPNWDKHIDHVVSAYRFTVQKSLKHSPFKLLMGFDPLLPSEAIMARPTYRFKSKDEYFTKMLSNMKWARDEARLNLSAAQVKMAQRYNKKVKPIKFYEGQKVWLDRDKFKEVPDGEGAKWQQKRDGPYRILRFHEGKNTAVLVEDVPGWEEDIHPFLTSVQRLTPASLNFNAIKTSTSKP